MRFSGALLLIGLGTLTDLAYRPLWPWGVPPDPTLVILVWLAPLDRRKVSAKISQIEIFKGINVKHHNSRIYKGLRAKKCARIDSGIALCIFIFSLLLLGVHAQCEKSI